MVLPSRGGSKEFCLAGTEDEHSPRLLALDEQHRRFWIDRCGLNLAQFLQCGRGQVAEAVFLADRTGKAILDNVQAVKERAFSTEVGILTLRLRSSITETVTQCPLNNRRSRISRLRRCKLRQGRDM